MSLFTILYYMTSTLWPYSACMFHFDSACIAIAIGGLAITLPMSPIFSICFFVSLGDINTIKTRLPGLMWPMVALLIMSLFDVFYVGWILTWISLQSLVEKKGIVKPKGTLMQPIIITNEAKREVPVPTDKELESPKGEQTVSHQQSVPSERETKIIV